MQTLNILIPMAGVGNRFKLAGYEYPKPLIPVFDKPMIQWVVESIGLNGRFIFLVLEEHYKQYDFRGILNNICKLYSNFEPIIIQVNKTTEGAACTALLAKYHIDNDNPLLIVNSDQFIKYDKELFITKAYLKKQDGIIFTFKSDGNLKWSYSKVKDNEIVEEIAEKRLLDDKNDATVGIYFYKKGSDFVKYAEQMIKKNIRTNNEFYLCPVYNEFIQDGKIITVFPVDEMWGLGTPEDKKYFEQNYKG